MSSFILQNEIPYSIMYPNMDLFSLSLKIFGSLCFVHNHSLHKIKLDSRSPRGIFLSYSRTQKGHKCFCPSMGRYILYVNATFFESKLEISTSLFVSEDNYDYLFYREIFLNSGESISESVTGKNLLQFQDPIQTYTQ